MSKKKYRKASSMTDEERAHAVALLHARGWPDENVLTQVANHLNIWPTTLKRWATGQSNPPPDKIVTEKKETIMEAIRAELYDIFPAMKAAREDATYRDLGWVAAVLVDKLQLLEGGPTERSQQEITVNRVGTSTLPPHLASRTDANNIRA